MDEIERKLAGMQADLFFFVLEDHVVKAGFPCITRSSEGHIKTCNILQLNRHMLPDVGHPSALILAQAAYKPTRLAIRATVLLQARKSV